VWRLNFTDGRWDKLLTESGYPRQYSIGPAGRIITLSTPINTPPGCQFYDGYTGDALSFVKNIRYVKVGEKWAIAKGTSYNSGLNAIHLDSWEENIFNIPCEFIRKILIYEPPPGGVSEMLEMRKSEE